MRGTEWLASQLRGAWHPTEARFGLRPLRRHTAAFRALFAGRDGSIVGFAKRAESRELAETASLL